MYPQFHVSSKAIENLAKRIPIHADNLEEEYFGRNGKIQAKLRELEEKFTTDHKRSQSAEASRVEPSTLLDADNENQLIHDISSPTHPKNCTKDKHGMPDLNVKKIVNVLIN